MSKPRTIADFPNKADDYDEAVSKSHDQNTDTVLDQGGDNEVTAEGIRDHVDSTENPHQVTAGQVGAYTKAETDQAIADAEVDAYTKEETREFVALPVPALPELLQVDPEQFNKALVSGYYEEGDTEKAVIWEWNDSRGKDSHDGWSCINPDHLAEIGSPEWYDPEGDGTDDDGDGVWERKNLITLTVFDFGARDEEGYDNTHHFQIMADSLGYVAIPDSEFPFAINGLTTTRQTRIFSSEDNARIKVLGISRQVCVLLEHSGSSVRGVHFDGNNTNKTLVRVTANDCDVDITGENVTADENAPNAEVSGLHIIANRTRFRIRAWDFANTGYTNESSPRVVTIGGTSNGFEGSVYGRDIQCGLTTGGNVVSGRINELHLENASDNGLYQLGGTSKLSVGSVIYRGSEEGLVVGGGSCEIDSYKVSGAGSAAISMMSGALKIGDMRVEGSPALGSPTTVLRMRDDANARKIEIGNLTGTIWGVSFMNLAPGTCESLRILSADLDFIYTTDRIGSILQWCNLDTAAEILLQNTKVTIRDVEDEMPQGSIFEVRVGSTFNDTNKVTLINPEFYIRDSEDERLGGRSLRIVRLNRDNCTISGVKMFVNLSYMVGREADYLGPFVAGINQSNNEPSGTFPIGTTVYRGIGDSSPYGWVYTQDGWEPLTLN